MEEIKDILNYEGLYEISKKGVVYRKQETYINNLGNKCIRKRNTGGFEDRFEWNYATSVCWDKYSDEKLFELYLKLLNKL